MATANIAPTKVVPVSTTEKPYYDDFNEDKNFHRILFRPGYAVQARELTQLQTIMQNQIERFGNHIFRNGSLILGGQISYDNNAQYIKLQPTSGGQSVIAGDFTSNNITYASSNAKVRAYVFGTKEAVGSDPPVLVVKYLTGTEFVESDSIVSESGVYANVATTTATGRATLASITDGIFFINGYFVKVPSQTIVVDKFSTQANAKVGLEYTDEIIDETDDTSLLDPAQEASNYQAPGATRLRVNFDLVTRVLDTTDEETFVELLRVENGIVKKQITTTQYAALGDTLARRTFDESGSYTVRRFKAALNDHPTDSSKFQVVLDPGKAYIKGYEFESIAQETLDLSKARDTSSVNNRDLTISIGNYLYTYNISGFFDTSTMELVDLHSVTNASIVSTNTTTYNSTKAATARVRQVRYYGSSGITDSNNDIMTVSIFETKYANLISNVAQSSANGISLFDNSSKFSSVDGAYTGSTIRITAGTGAGEAYTIVNYVGSTKTLNVTQNWINTPGITSNLSIDFDSDSLKSVVKYSTQTAGATTTAATNIHPYSKLTLGSPFNWAFFTDASRNTLVFPTGDSFIANNTIADVSYEYVAVKDVNFDASGTALITLDAGDTFYSITDSTGISSTTLNGIVIFRNDTGKRIKISTVTISGVTATVTIPNEGGTLAAKAYVRTNAGSSKLYPKRKTLRQTNSTTKQANGSSVLTQTTSAGTTTAYVDDTDGTCQILITNPSNTPKEKMSLFMSDVKSISKIYDLNQPTTFPADGTALSSYADVTSSYEFDDGQRDSFYDHATIALVPKSGTIKGPLLICYNYYAISSGSSDGNGFFTVDSYIVPETYEGIPSYTTTDGTVLQLRDSIDFRPHRTNKVTTSPNYTLNYIRIPTSTTSFQADYSYYLPRKSIVTLTTDPTKPFKIIDGISAANPVDPKIDDNSMILYKFALQPYTIDKTAVNITFVENKRYTMRDIGKLETRVQNLEYYQTLSILEKAADSLKILDNNGLDRTKYGILADDFTTHKYGNVDNLDYSVSIDTVEGGMEATENTTSMLLSVTSNTNTVKTDSVVMLKFTEEVFASQNLATKWVNVQPYMLAQWVGTVYLDPPDDNWVETGVAPDVILNTGNNDAIESHKNEHHHNHLRFNKRWWRRHFGLPHRFS